MGLSMGNSKQAISPFRIYLLLVDLLVILETDLATSKQKYQRKLKSKIVRIFSVRMGANLRAYSQPEKAVKYQELISPSMLTVTHQKVLQALVMIKLQHLKLKFA